MNNTTDIHDKNPWKGLNFYKEGEILYGRDNEIRSLSQYVINNTQTVLYGRSGIGKSSIINAGLFPIARKEGIFPVPLRLKHGKEDSYIEQIKEAFVETGVGINEIVPPIAPTGETMWEYLHRHTFFDTRDNTPLRPLIVFDQFEEIFTLQQDEYKKKMFFSELADLINEVTPQYIVDNSLNDNKKSGTSDGDKTFSLDFGNEMQDKGPEYIKESNFNLLFSIREDFLSYLERYTTYIPAMKSNRYPLQPINEEQAADIIMKPQEGLVNADVARLIIEKVTGRSDFSFNGISEIEVDAAVLSLYLSRLFIKKGTKKREITADLVNQFGDDIIKDFYEEAVSTIDPKMIGKLEEQLLTYDGRRNNVSRNDLIKKGVPGNVIKELVEKKKLLRQFSYQDDIRIEFMHDILCSIVSKRIEQRIAIKEQEKIIKKQQEERRRIIERGRKRFLLSFGISNIFAIAILLYIFLFRFSYSDEYANFTTRNGWPVGIGHELSESEKKSLTVHYRLRRPALLKISGFSISKASYTEVEILNSNGEKTTNKFIESPLVSLADAEGKDKKASYFSKMQLQTASWKFVADESGKISRQTAYDINGKVLYSQQYYYSISEADSNLVQSLWLNYLDKSGKPFHVRDNCADRMRVKEKDGYHVGYQFFSETGTPQKNSRNVYGYKYNIEEGIIKSIIPIDEFGDPIDGQSLHFTSFDKYGRWLEAENNAQATYTASSVVFSMGNVTDTLIYDNNGFLEYRSEVWDNSIRNVFHYDTLRNVVKEFAYKGDKLIKSIKNEYFPGGSDIKERIVFDSIYSRELFERRGDTLIASYYTSENGKWSVPSLKKIKIDEQQDTLLATTEIEITCDSTGQELENKRSIYFYDKQKLQRKFIEYKEGKLTTSVEYEVEDGQIVGQHVLGITGDTIRCAELDNLGYSYYRIRYVRNFDGERVAVKAINEFGEESMMADISNNVQNEFAVVPSKEIVEENKQSITYGKGIFCISYKPLNKNRCINYLRITDTLGTYYKSGIKDGDVLLEQNNSSLKVARPVKNRIMREKVGYYEILTFTPEPGNNGAETDTVYYTEKEWENFRKSTDKK